MKVTLILLGFVLCMMNGCSGGGAVTPVLAQSGYSNASVTGTYSLLLAVGSQGSGTGSFKADGNGSITAGTLNIVNSGSSCTATFSGAYTLSSTAVGTATITATPQTGASNACLGNWSQLTNGKFNVQAGANGATLLF